MWSPKEVRKTISLLFGLGFIIWGAIMMTNNISATGNIELKTSILEGKIQTGSAGLFLSIIGLFVVAFSMLKTEGNELKLMKNATNKVILAICLLVFFLIAIILYVYLNNSTILVFVVSALVVPFAWLIRAIIQE